MVYSCRALVALVASAALFTFADSPRILNIGNTAEPGTLDPHRYFSNAEEHILKDLFLGLTTMGPKAEILPGVAESWHVSGDGLVWRFELDPSAVWSDGEPLTANDFVFSMRRLLNPSTASPLAHFLYCVKNAEAINGGTIPYTELGVRAVGPHTLEIELAQPFPFLLERILYPIAYPVPQHVIEDHGDSWVKGENWVSNGAYTLERWRPLEYVQLRKNPRFQYASDVVIETVRYYPLAEPATAYNRYVTGEMDMVYTYPQSLLTTVERERSNEVQNSQLQSIMYLVLNMHDDTLQDIRVRKALALAIRKRRLTESILGAGEIPSDTISPPIVSGFRTPTTHKTALETASDLLTAAGYDAENPLQIELRHISGEANKRVYIAIAAMWKEVGIETTLHHTNLPTHFSDLQTGNFQVAQAGWFGENNPEHYIELLWSEIGPANYGRYQSESFDKLLEQAKSTADLEVRLDLLAEAESIALAEFPVIPLYVTMTLNLVKPHVAGWERNGRNLHPVRFLSWN